MTPVSVLHGLFSYFTPFRKWWPIVNKKTIQSDLVAGIVGALIVLPQGVAFATIAGLPPQYGLYAAIIPTIIAALFGSSWHLVSGPTTAISLVVFGAISPLAEAGSTQFITFTITLAFLVGVTQLLMGFFRFGTLLNFISHTVVIGFTAGASILIASSQIKNFFGVKIIQGSTFWETMVQFFGQIDQINWYVTATALITIIIGILVKRFWPKLPYMIPAMLIGSAFGMALIHFFGADVVHIKTVGAIPASLPPFSMPDLSSETVKKLLPSALAITLLALTEAVSIARAIAVKSGQRIDGNQEFVGQGLSNIFGSLFSAYPASGSFNRSGLNFEAGAKTPLACIFAAVALILVILVIAPYAAYLPLAVMAAILFLVAYGLIDQKHIKAIFQTSKQETAVLIATFLATLFIELEFAIFVGVILSLMLYLNRTSQPRVYTGALVVDETGKRKFMEYIGQPVCPQLQFVRIDGSLFFGAVSSIAEQLNDLKSTANTRLICSKSINFIDIAGAEMLVSEAKRYQKIGKRLAFCGLKPEVLELLRKGNYMKEIGEENFFPSKADAIKALIPSFDLEICKNCTVRSFLECPSAAK